LTARFKAVRRRAKEAWRAEAAAARLQIAQPGLDVFGLEFDQRHGAQEGLDVAADLDFVDFVGCGFALGSDDVQEPVVQPGADGEPLGAEWDALLLEVQRFVQLLGDNFAGLAVQHLAFAEVQ
jgi:hypothetical protein